MVYSAPERGEAEGLFHAASFAIDGGFALPVGDLDGRALLACGGSAERLAGEFNSDADGRLWALEDEAVKLAGSCVFDHEATCLDACSDASLSVDWF